MARVLPGERRGAATAARLRLEAPLVARAGDRFVVRSYSPVTTIGGGVVVDPQAGDLVRERGRPRPLPVPLPATDRDRVLLLIGRRGRHGLRRAALEVAVGCDAVGLDAALAAAGDAVSREGDWYVATAVVAATEDVLLGALRSYHEAHPLDPGSPAQAWRAAPAAPHAELVELAERRLERRGGFVRDGATVRLPDWEPGGGAAARAATAGLLHELAGAGAEPPSVGELSAAHPGLDVPATLRLLARQGLVVGVGRERFYAREAFERERDAVIGVLGELGEASPAVIRERLGRSRKWLIPLLEQLDRDGVTARRGDVRVLATRRLS